MENTDINTSDIENIDIDRILKETIKEKIEKLIIYPTVYNCYRMQRNLLIVILP